jgi:cell division protein FtsW (lipid II flippase)
LALILAVFPRLIAVIAVMTCTFVLLRTKEWRWVQRRRLALLVAAIIALISLALDAEFFPRSLVRNGARWIGLALWTLYFSVSERVRGVFQTHDWEAERRIMNITGL